MDGTTPMPDPREVLIEAERRYPMNRVVDDPEGAAGWAETDPYGYDEHAREAFVAGAEWYRSAVETAVTADPQEALREQMRKALPCTAGDGCPRHETQRLILDAVLPVVQAHTQALRDDRDDAVAALRRVVANESNHYDRYWTPVPEPLTTEWLAETKAKMREALEDVFCDDAAAVMLTLIAEIERLASLRDAVSRLADELQKDAAHARKRQRDPADALALHRFLGDERTYLHAARRLRSLLGDKEAQQ